MRHLSIPSRTVLVIAAVAAFAGCERSSAVPTEVDHLTAHANRGAATALAGHGDLLKAVRQSTARFNSTTQAVRAGYVGDPHCVAHPVLGGMGYHWVNQALIDPVFDALQPEALLYAPGSGPNPRVVGVEYIVIDVGQEQPHFNGHPFDVDGVPPLMAAGVAHWSLHVWVHEANAAGLFAPFNPNVSCN